MEMAKEMLSLKSDSCVDSFTVPSYYPSTVNCVIFSLWFPSPHVCLGNSYSKLCLFSHMILLQSAPMFVCSEGVMCWILSQDSFHFGL